MWNLLFVGVCVKFIGVVVVVVVEGRRSVGVLLGLFGGIVSVERVLVRLLF